MTGMLTADGLKDLARGFQNESFCLRLLGMGLADRSFDRPRAAMAAGDAHAARDRCPGQL